MGIIKKEKISIPIKEFSDVDKLFFHQLQMTPERVLKKYKTQYLETKEKFYSSITAEGIFASSKIERRWQNVLLLEREYLLDSSMLFRAFQKSEEVVACAVTLKGFDALEREEKDKMKSFFYDSWGTVFIGRASSWLKFKIQENLERRGIYSTCVWSPGQHNISIKLQKVLFQLLEPEEIGITLNNSFMMRPKKSISLFFGIGTDDSIERIRACDFCERRESCPSAYNNVG